MTPRVSLVLPCRNELRHIEACLTSILHQDPPDGGFEVIVADGMSDDGTREILARMEQGAGGSGADARGQKLAVDGQPPEAGGQGASSPGASPVSTLRVIDNPGRIVSTGLNAAIRAARGMVIVRLDAHSEYAPDYVRRCVEILEQTGADNVGGPWVAKGDRYLSRAIAAVFQSPFGVGGARSLNLAYEGAVDSVYLGCWRKASFEQFGYFDEELVRNQDDEHNLRITRLGGKIYQSPQIRSCYRPRGSLGALFKQYMQYGYWKVRVIQKHKLPASWRHLVPGAFVLTLLALVLLSAFSGLLSTIAADHLRLPAHFSFQLSAFSFLALGGTYLLAVTIASVLTARKTEWRLLPILPLVFPCYHFGYGYGFLRGIWDFVLRRRGAGTSFQRLTR